MTVGVGCVVADTSVICKKSQGVHADTEQALSSRGPPCDLRRVALIFCCQLRQEMSVQKKQAL